MLRGLENPAAKIECNWRESPMMDSESRSAVKC